MLNKNIFKTILLFFVFLSNFAVATNIPIKENKEKNLELQKQFNELSKYEHVTLNRIGLKYAKVLLYIQMKVNDVTFKQLNQIFEQNNNEADRLIAIQKEQKKEIEIIKTMSNNYFNDLNDRFNRQLQEIEEIKNNTYKQNK